MSITTQIRNIQKEHQTFHNSNKHRFNFSRKCSCCSKEINQDEMTFIGETSIGIWFNCNHCNSTMVQKAVSCSKHEIQVPKYVLKQKQSVHQV